MKSRYDAYVRADIDYIANTSCKEISDEERAQLLDWAKNSHWQSLEIINFSEYMVEFKAYYIYKQKQYIHHERSTFKRKKDGSWCYEDGEFF